MIRTIKQLASHTLNGMFSIISRILQLNTFDDLQDPTAEDTICGEEKEVQRMETGEAVVSVQQIDYQKGNLLITKNFTYFFKEHMFVFPRKVKEITDI